jgi:hypothetical protein
MTIYQSLHLKLGRDPTNAEIKAEVSRIKLEAITEQANAGRLVHQTKPTKRQ